MVPKKSRWKNSALAYPAEILPSRPDQDKQLADRNQIIRNKGEKL